MENRDYLKMYGEDCTANIKCENCEQREQCKEDIEETFGVKVDLQTT